MSGTIKYNRIIHTMIDLQSIQKYVEMQTMFIDLDTKKKKWFKKAFYGNMILETSQI